MSIPRLELTAAVLLARLMHSIRTMLRLFSLPCHGWTDSTVTLAWLRQHPSTWRTFIAHRVSKIQTLLPDAQWHHVPSQQNAADCASRGWPAQNLADYAVVAWSRLAYVSLCRMAKGKPSLTMRISIGS